jgi:hypothetical protein
MRPRCPVERSEAPITCYASFPRLIHSVSAGEGTLRRPKSTDGGLPRRRNRCYPAPLGAISTPPFPPAPLIPLSSHHRLLIVSTFILLLSQSLPLLTVRTFSSNISPRLSPSHPRPLSWLASLCVLYFLALSSITRHDYGSLCLPLQPSVLPLARSVLLPASAPGFLSSSVSV